MKALERRFGAGLPDDTGAEKLRGWLKALALGFETEGPRARPLLDHPLAEATGSVASAFIDRLEKPAWLA